MAGGGTVRNLKNQSGQILLITLLVLAFAVTVAISVISRSTTDVSISNQQEDSAKAFSAAEAGIEEGMRTSQDIGVTTLTAGTQYKVDVINVGGAAGIYTFPSLTDNEITETLWLANHNADGSLDVDTKAFVPATGTIDICWNKPGADVPAVVMTILYKRGTSYLVAKEGFDPTAGRRATNYFLAPTSATKGAECGTGDYRNRVRLSDYGINLATDNLLMLRLRPVYTATEFSIDAGGTVLPLQGKTVTSTGTTSSGATRKIVVVQQFSSLETFFDAALYSQTSLTK